MIGYSKASSDQPSDAGTQSRDSGLPLRNGKTRILLIEDSLCAFKLIAGALEKESERSASVRHAESLREALVKLQTEAFDAVLLDLHLPDADALESLSRIKEVKPGLPVLFLTGEEDYSIAHAVIQRGAQEYLIKTKVQGASVLRAIQYSIDRQRFQNDFDSKWRSRAEMRSQLLSNVSHELRTPLAVVDQYASILADGLVGALNEEQADAVSVILSNTARLKSLIGDLLDASRAEGGRLSLKAEEVNVVEMVDQVIRSQALAARAKRIGLISHVSPDLPSVYGDPLRIHQILTNLVDNAIKFTPRGGVTIIAETHEPGRGFIRITVCDTGCGISRDDSLVVFDRLYQGSDGSQTGLGLGLYIAKVLVEWHGGKIWLRSTPGKGSSFIFTLPASQNRVNDAASSSVMERQDNGE